MLICLDADCWFERMQVCLDPGLAAQYDDLKLSHCTCKLWTVNATVMHAGSFSVNRRWRAQNGTGSVAFGGVGREVSKIRIPISHDNKLSNNHKK